MKIANEIRGKVQGEEKMGSKIILLLDSNPTIQKVVELTFADTDYQIISLNVNLSSVEDAMEKIRHISPNLVLLDLDLPGIGGKNICRKLKEDPSLAHLPVILLVRELDRYPPEKLQEYGRVIGKPFEASDLLRSVEECFYPGQKKVRRHIDQGQGIPNLEAWLRRIVEEKLEEFLQRHLEEIVADRVDRFLQSEYCLHQFQEIFTNNKNGVSQHFIENSKNIIEGIARKMVPEQARVMIQREIDRIKSGR